MPTVCRFSGCMWVPWCVDRGCIDLELRDQQDPGRNGIKETQPWERKSPGAGSEWEGHQGCDHIKTYPPIYLKIRECGSQCPEINVGAWSHQQTLHAGIASSLTLGTLLTLPRWRGRDSGDRMTALTRQPLRMLRC